MEFFFPKGLDKFLIWHYNSIIDSKFGNKEVQMERKNTYSILNGKIAERNYKKKEIAAALNISPRAFRNKLNGIQPFLWSEVRLIHSTFFPDITIDELMQN